MPNERNAGRKPYYEGETGYITFRIPLLKKEEIKKKVYKILETYKVRPNQNK